MRKKTIIVPQNLRGKNQFNILWIKNQNPTYYHATNLRKKTIMDLYKNTKNKSNPFFEGSGALSGHKLILICVDVEKSQFNMN